MLIVNGCRSPPPCENTTAAVSCPLLAVPLPAPPVTANGPVNDGSFMVSEPPSSTKIAPPTAEPPPAPSLVPLPPSTDVPGVVPPAPPPPNTDVPPVTAPPPPPPMLG